MNQCLWEKATINGMSGWRVTSKKTGYTDKSIFIPAAGYRLGTTYCFYEYNDSMYGFYWAATIKPGYSSPYAVYFSCFSDSQGPFFSDDRRFQGDNIRPVKSK